MKQKHFYFLMPFLAMSSAHAATLMGGVTLGPLSGVGGSSSFATWHTMNSYNASSNPSGLVNTGGYPGTTMWAPQSAQTGSTQTNTQLVKISNGAGGFGGPSAGSDSIYYGGFSGVTNVDGGTLALRTSDPLANLKTVVFQLQIGEAATFDFYNHTLPSLTYTLTGDATLYSLAASGSSNYSKLDNGTIMMPTGEEPLYINSYAMWFDFSAVTGDLASFDVSWTGVQHAQLFGASLQQSDEVATISILPPAAVPEPSALLLGGVAGLFMLRRRK